MIKEVKFIFVLVFFAGATANAQQPMVKMTSPAPSFAMQATNVSMSAGGQVKDDLFAGTEKFANGAKEVTEINLDSKTMGMVGSKKVGDDIARKMNFMVIHTYTYDKPGMYS